MSARPPAARALDRSISESEFMRTVTDALEVCGWTWQHSRPARTQNGWRTAISGHAGFPDICAVRVRSGIVQLLFAELKREGETPTRAQRIWLDLLGQVPFIDVFCWHPSDWPEAERTIA